MNRSLLQIEFSGWWVLLIAILSVAISLFLYSRKDIPWNRFQNWLLFGVRSLAIFMILLLLLEPSVKRISNSIIKPTIALAIDNSESILGRGADSLAIKSEIRSLEEELMDQGLDVKILTMDLKDSIQFDQKNSRIADLLDNTINEFENENLRSIILFSDGIYNRGISPLYKNYIQPIFSVGMGDSIPPQDIAISRVQYNKVSFKGNQSPIKIELNQTGFNGQNVTVSIHENNKELETQKLLLDDKIKEVEFQLTSEKEGLRHIVVKVTSFPQESTALNNRVDLFLEIIDARQKVLIVANSPHPDIKAIRSTLAATDNYTTDLYIPALNEEKPTEPYDVVIYHSAFTSSTNFIPKGNPGIWYILSGESAITVANKKLDFLNIEKRRGQADKVSGSFNQNFSKYKITNSTIFEDYPPIEVPYGEYAVSGPSEILMYQKLGSVITDKPLMIVHDDGIQKSAVLMGQNIWTWKLQEAAINGNAIHFNDFVTKTIQYLSIRNDKKQFRLDARESTFSDSSPILFDSEVYNDIYERTYGNTIQIAIENEAGETQYFDFVDSELNQSFSTPSLPPGIYTFKGEVKIGNKTLTDNGEFSVEDINPEYINLTANHQLLRNLASKTGGQFIPFEQVDRLINLIANQGYKPLVKSEETTQKLLQTWWWYTIIFGLFSLEWFLRRYWGSY